MVSFPPLREDLRPLRPTRASMSTLASVVSLGSPGSATFSAETSAERPELLRNLLGFGPLPALLRSCRRLGSGPAVSPSSLEASRDEGCKALLEMLSAALSAFLLRLLLCGGDDIVMDLAFVSAVTSMDPDAIG